MWVIKRGEVTCPLVVAKAFDANKLSFIREADALLAAARQAENIANTLLARAADFRARIDKIKEEADAQNRAITEAAASVTATEKHQVYGVTFELVPDLPNGVLLVKSPAGTILGVLRLDPADTGVKEYEHPSHLG